MSRRFEPTMTDEQLVATLRRDSQAFDELYRRYAERILKFVRFRVPTLQEAEDITSQVFIRVLEAHWSFSARYKFSTWIFTITKRLIIDHYRKQKPVIDLEHFDELASNINIEHELSTSQELEAALRQLTDVERTMLTMHVVDGLKYREIALAFGVSTAAIKKRFERLKSRFSK